VLSPSQPGAPPWPGAVGLKNLGNTCYMNAVLQCLLKVERLRDFFFSMDADHANDVLAAANTGYRASAPFLEDVNEGNVLGSGGHVARAFGGFVSDVWSGAYRAVVPVRLKEVIANFASQFEGCVVTDRRGREAAVILPPRRFSLELYAQ